MVPQRSDPPGKRIRVNFKPGSSVPFKDRDTAALVWFLFPIN
jgi:hypothetical protein